MDVVAGMRVDAVVRSAYDQRGGAERSDIDSVSCDLPRDATSAVISGLTDKTEYVVTVRAVTAAYFDMLPDGHAMKRSRRLPADRLPTDDAWLPAATTVVTTSGTDRPTDLHVVDASPDSISLAWTLPRTYGSDQLQGTVIRWVSSWPMVYWLGGRTPDRSIACGYNSLSCNIVVGTLCCIIYASLFTTNGSIVQFEKKI